MFGALRTAIRFLTRLPVPGPHELAEGELPRSMGWYPLVGACVGGLLGLLAVLLFRWTPLPAGVVATLVALAGPLLTGGLHEDGLADTFDGLGGATSRERALEIMRDSRVGTYGALALSGTLLLRWNLIVSLHSDAWLRTLVVAHAVARLPPVVLVRGLPYARAGEGLARPMVEGITTTHVVAALALSLAIAVPLGGSLGLLAVILALLTARVAGWWFRRRVGGITGDLAGATVIVTELLVLAGAALRYPTG